MLELASLLLDFRFAFECQAVGEQPFRESMAADYVGGALAAALGQFDDHAAVADGNAGWLEGIVARIDERLVVVCNGRMRGGFDQSHLAHFFDRHTHGQGSVHFHAVDFRDLTVL